MIDNETIEELRGRWDRYPVPYVHGPLEDAVKSAIYEHVAKLPEVIITIKNGNVKLEATWEHK